MRLILLALAGYVGYRWYTEQRGGNAYASRPQPANDYPNDTAARPQAD